MAEEKEKAIEKDPETIKPAGSKKDELAEKDLDKASGGLNPQPLPPSPPPEFNRM
jgi:hypothetical protein